MARRLSLSADGKTLVLVDQTGVPAFVDVASGKEIAAGAGHKDAVQSVQFIANGQRLLTHDILPTRGFTTLINWDAATGKENTSFNIGGPGHIMAVSQDGAVIAMRRYNALRRKA